MHPPRRTPRSGRRAPHGGRALAGWLVLAAALPPAALAPACSGPGTHSSARTAAQGDPTRVRYVDFRSGKILELVNEAHSDRVELYSQERTSAATKVTTDEVMEELVKLFREEGFDRVAHAGPAPEAGDLTSSLEVEVDGKSRYLAMGAGTTADERAVYNQCLRAFVPLYSNVYGLQTVNNPDGTEFFEDAKQSR